VGSAKEKVRALIDQYIESQGIDPKVPPIDILSLDFKTHVQRHRSIKAQAAEMEFAARHHISIHYDEDPVYYKNLSERLTEILESLADNWGEKVEALRQYIEQIQAGRPTNDERDGQLILASPPEVPMETLENVVRDKRLWIYSKLLKKESLNPPTAVKEYVSGEGFYYLGRSYRLKLVDGVKGQSPLRLYQSRFELQRDAQARGREEFIRWYCDRLRPILDTQIAASD
jgi:hypothetical protein